MIEQISYSDKNQSSWHDYLTCTNSTLIKNALKVTSAE